VALEHFKKQVLLLHSEQSTLDNLSAGFNDRYTVHCATSGSEALNTLGDIQIDVIVTAQDLPGMSGLDALREAKKRSPDTVGILLAGNENSGLEALVGDKEVFQIVRGEVTPSSLKNLIDNATRQARLMALAESANDMTASPDEPSGEHIVMETSENGSTIISDGTGRLPILDAKKVSAAAGVGARAVDVLVLTQDEEFLATVQESARGLHNIIYANTLAQAEEAIRKTKVGVAVVDAAMVGANVEKLTMHLRAASPRLVAIVAGRRDDGEMLMDLINRGKVYRFLLKPVSPGRSRLAIEASVKHHLEAPDSAFKVAGAAAAPIAPAPKPVAKPIATPKPAPAPAPKPAAVSKPAVAKAPTTPAPKEPAKARVESTSTIVPKRDEALSPINEGLSEAFGGGDSSFTETITGIVDSVGQTFASFRKKTNDPEATMVATPTPAAASAGGAGGSLLSNPKILGIGATALVVVVGLAFWLFSGSDEPGLDDEVFVTTPSVTEDKPVFEQEVVSPQEIGLDDLIDEAQLAATAGQIYNPPGSNAIELYVAALDVAPGDPVAEVGLQQVIEQALGMAETALLEHRAEDAVAALQRVELANPDNPRLPFLNAQLSQMQLRDSLNDARQAIRESRFEDAQLALNSAGSLAITDTTEIDTVRNELNAALSEQRVDEVLAKANTRLSEGLLVAPSNDNARYYYELALSNDPGNTAARQGLKVVAGKLVLQAREQIDAGNFQAADALLADARRLDPSSSELSASTAALQAARDRRTQDVRRATEQRAAADRAATAAAAAKQAAAEQAAAELAAAEQAAAEQAVTNQAAADQESTAEEARTLPIADAAPEPLAAASDQNVAESSDTSEVGPTNAEPDSVVNAEDGEPTLAEPVEELQTSQSQAAATVAPAPARPVSVSSLSRSKYVAPKYPRAAQRRGLSGWVDVVFTVDIDGTVSAVEVRDSNPGETFVAAASNAVEQWEFEPVIENGVAVQKRAAVRMMFAIE
jgi:serine/threonine-protein kinase